MDTMPLGMGQCYVTDRFHLPVFSVENERVECLHCELPVEEWSIYIPERGENIDIWLSLYVISEEPT